MKNSLLLSLVMISIIATGKSQVSFDRFFIDSTMRVDLYHVGDKNAEFYTLDRTLRQGTWAGTTVNLIDPFNYGRYRARLVDVASNTLIYSRGYDAYFGEYKTTEPAKNGTKRVFEESILLPFPRHSVLLVIDRRDPLNVYQTLFEQLIDPLDYHIIAESPFRKDAIIPIQHSGDPHHSVDLVFVAEGYTAPEQTKFEMDIKRYVDTLFTWEPYKEFKSHFNITGVFSPSAESGVDEPRQGSYKKTLLNATFNSLDSDRYLLTEENRVMRDVAAQVPYDAVLVIVNSKRYGGGGIYNDFTAFTSDGPTSDFVFVHEFGHALSALGDEYLGDVSYEDFYPKGVEPTEPNLTALLDPDHLKWKDLVSPGMTIPTDWGESRYDSLSARRTELFSARAKRLADMRKVSASQGEIKDTTARYAEEIDVLNKKISSFLEDHPLKGKVGAFEGGGYMHKGIYRPTVNSLMNQFFKSDRRMYPVSEQAVKAVLEYYIR